MSPDLPNLNQALESSQTYDYYHYHPLQLLSLYAFLYILQLLSIYNHIFIADGQQHALLSQLHPDPPDQVHKLYSQQMNRKPV